MIRIETGESAQSRRTPPPPKQKLAKQPGLLKRIFGASGTRQPRRDAKCEKCERCPAGCDPEILLV